MKTVSRIMLAVGLVVVCCTVLCACAASKKGMSGVVPYRVAERYFVRSDVVGLPPAVISTVGEFERNFGMAAVMGPNGLPTKIDFKKSFVICVALDPTDVATDLSVKSLTADGAGQLVLSYEVKQGAKMSYTVQPLMLLIVDRKYEMPVKICRAG